MSSSRRRDAPALPPAQLLGRPRVIVSLWALSLVAAASLVVVRYRDATNSLWHDYQGYFLPAATLVAEQVAQRARLARLWWAHPGELTRYVEARFWRLRGTHTRPQADSRTLTDLLRMPATRLGLRR